MSSFRPFLCRSLIFRRIIATVRASPLLLFPPFLLLGCDRPTPAADPAPTITYRQNIAPTPAHLRAPRRRQGCLSQFRNPNPADRPALGARCRISPRQPPGDT